MVYVFFLALLFSSSAYARDFPFRDVGGALDSKRWFTSNGWANGPHQSCEWRKEALTLEGEVLTITLSDQHASLRAVSCGELQGRERLGYGSYSARIKAAAGSGLNTAFFTYIGPANHGGDHSEIDFEFLGKNPRTVQLNFFDKTGKAQDGTMIELGFDASADFHEYRFVWEPHRIRWYVDGKQVHETKAGASIPTNPPRIYLSLWSGDPSMNDWLGPFTYTAPVQAQFTDVKYEPLRNTRKP